MRIDVIKKSTHTKFEKLSNLQKQHRNIIKRPYQKKAFKLYIHTSKTYAPPHTLCRIYADQRIVENSHHTLAITLRP